MILRAKARKANGSPAEGWWYVASEYVDNHQLPNFTITQDIGKAKHFTIQEANQFNNKFKSMGMISDPFEICK